jgi:hypothetical protein
LFGDLTLGVFAGCLQVAFPGWLLASCLAVPTHTGALVAILSVQCGKQQPAAYPHPIYHRQPWSVAAKKSAQHGIISGLMSFVVNYVECVCVCKSQRLTGICKCVCVNVLVFVCVHLCVCVCGCHVSVCLNGRECVFVCVRIGVGVSL